MTADEKRRKAAKRKKAAYRRAVYHAAKKAGRCVQVGCQQPAAFGFARCLDCLDWLRERTRAANRKARTGHPRATRPY
jgi:hypothetical protein